MEKNYGSFKVLMFLNADNSGIRSLGTTVSILGKEMFIKSWDELGSLKTDEFWNDVKLNLLSNAILARVNDNLVAITWDFVPVQFEVTTYGPEAAVSLAQEEFDALRAFLNMAVIRGRFTLFSQPANLPFS
jgi:hypothetical protein